MRRTLPARAGALAVGMSLACLGAPAPAQAHGLVARADLPLPGWMFVWGAAVVLVVSFVGLAVLWPEPKLQGRRERQVLDGASRIITHPAVDAACGAIGIALLGIVLWSGFAGEWPSEHNFAEVFVFVIFWVGLVPASVLFGDVYRAFNPWLALGRGVGWLLRKGWGDALPEPLPYPPRLGYWPAAAGLFAFGWLELAHTSSARALAWATLVYSAVQALGMALYGPVEWSRRGDAFSVYFNLFARIGPWARRGRQLFIRPPLRGLVDWPVLAGGVALFAVIIGTVTFDGASGGPLWQRLLPHVRAFWADFGLGPRASLEAAGVTGLFACILLIGAFYAIGIRGVRTAGGDLPASRLRGLFLHTLAPIALAYAGAHYLSLLAYTGQEIYAVASDPIGRGWDLFGTAQRSIDYSVIDTNQIWWSQLTLVVTGHVLALVLAHDKALAIYGRARAAARSQYWMLAVMVGYTSLALWLLHTADTNV